MYRYTYTTVEQTYYKDSDIDATFLRGPRKETTFDRWRRPIKVKAYDGEGKPIGSQETHYWKEAENSLPDNWKTANYNEHSVPYQQPKRIRSYSYDDQGDKLLDAERRYPTFDFRMPLKQEEYLGTSNNTDSMLSSSIEVPKKNNTEYDLGSKKDFVIGKFPKRERDGRQDEIRVPLTVYYPKMFKRAYYAYENKRSKTSVVQYDHKAYTWQELANQGTVSDGEKLLLLSKAYTTVDKASGSHNLLRSPALYYLYDADGILSGIDANAYEGYGKFSEIPWPHLPTGLKELSRKNNKNLEGHNFEQNIVEFSSEDGKSIEGKPSVLKVSKRVYAPTLPSQKESLYDPSTYWGTRATTQFRKHYDKGEKGCLQQAAKGLTDRGGAYLRTDTTYSTFTGQPLTVDSPCSHQTIKYDQYGRPTYITRFIKAETLNDHTRGTTIRTRIVYTDLSDQNSHYRIHVSYDAQNSIFHSGGTLGYRRIVISDTKDYVYDVLGRLESVRLRKGPFVTNRLYEYDERGNVVKLKITKDRYDAPPDHTAYYSQTIRNRYDDLGRKTLTRVPLSKAQQSATSNDAPARSKTITYKYFFTHRSASQRAKRILTAVQYRNGHTTHMAYCRMKSVALWNTRLQRAITEELLPIVRDRCPDVSKGFDGSTPILLSKTVLNSRGLPILTSSYNRRGETHYTYDSKGYLVALKHELTIGGAINPVFHISYDNFTGKPTSVYFDTGRHTAPNSATPLGYDRAYNSWGRLISKTMPGRQISSGTNDKKYFSFVTGNPASTSLVGKTTDLRYDDYGRVTQLSSGLQEVDYHYNVMNQIEKTEYKEEQHDEKFLYSVIDNTYNYTLGQDVFRGDWLLTAHKQTNKTVKGHPDTAVSQIRYKARYPDGSLKTVVRNGAETTFTYNPYAGLLLSQDVPEYKTSISYSHDLFLRLSKKTLLDNEVQGYKKEYTYTYNPNFWDPKTLHIKITSSTAPTTKREEHYKYTYDKFRRLSELDSGIHSTFAKSDSKLYTGATTDYEHTRSEKFSYYNNKLSSYVCKDHGGQKICPYDAWSRKRIKQRHYLYDKLGNLTTIRHTDGNVPDANEVKFSYTKQGAPSRRTGVRYKNESKVYKYDDEGNVLSDGFTSYTYSPLNQLRKIKDNQDTSWSRMRYASSPVPTQVLSDYNPNYPTNIFLDEFGFEKAGRYTRNHQSFHGVRAITANNGAPESVETSQEGYTFRNRFIKGPLGRVTANLNNDGGGYASIAYTPYGDNTGLSGLLGLSFGPNSKLSIHGVQFLGARVYSPKLKMFLQHDTSSPFSLGGFSGYAYGAGNPVLFSDPTGHISNGLNIVSPMRQATYARDPLDILTIVNIALMSAALIAVILTAGLALPAVMAGSFVLAAVFIVGTALSIASLATGIAAEVTDNQTLRWISLGTGLAALPFDIYSFATLVRGPTVIGAASRAVARQARSLAPKAHLSGELCSFTKETVVTVVQKLKNKKQVTFEKEISKIKLGDTVLI